MCYLDVRFLENFHKKLTDKLDNHHFEDFCPMSKSDVRTILDMIGELEALKERQALEKIKEEE